MASEPFSSTTPFNYQYDDILDDEDASAEGFFDQDKSQVIKMSLDDELASSKHLMLATTTLEPNDSAPLTGQGGSSENYNFEALLHQRQDESNEFRLAIIGIGLTLIATGILANLIFKLLVVCRKGKRQTCTTLTMASMCLAYLIFLVLYSLKLTVYMSGDNIIKFHVYDTIDNWLYGQFMCQMISGLPFCVKLISRLSILAMVAKRILNIVVCDCSQDICGEFVNKEGEELSDEVSEQTRLKSNAGSESISNRGSFIFFLGGKGAGYIEIISIKIRSRFFILYHLVKS